MVAFSHTNEMGFRFFYAKGNSSLCGKKELFIPIKKTAMKAGLLRVGERRTYGSFGCYWHLKQNGVG